MKYLFVIPVVALGVACCSQKKAEAGASIPSSPEGSVAVTGPHAIVYRTRTDVGNAVPITLSEDGKSVVSYPHPKDLGAGDDLSVPTSLGKGYLLDNRGIGPNSVFLRWTYAEYAALDKPPTVDELMAAIVHRDPFQEMCDCGVRSIYTDPAKELAAIVDAGSLPSRCKKLK